MSAIRVEFLLLLLGACVAEPLDSGETIPPSVLEGKEGQAEGAFADCTARRLGADGFDISCATFALEIEQSEKSNFEEALDSFVRTRILDPVDDSAEETTVQSYTLSVGGSQYPGRRYERRSEVTPESADVGYVVIAENQAGEIVALSCTSREIEQRKTDLEGKCRKAMLEFIRRGVPDGLAGGDQPQR